MVFTTLALGAKAVAPRANVGRESTKGVSIRRQTPTPAFASKSRNERCLAKIPTVRKSSSRLIVRAAGGEGEEDDEENQRREAEAEVEVVDDDEDEDEDDEDEGSAPPPPSKCEELIAKLEESMDAPELAELAAEVKAIETAFKDLQAANVGLEDQTGALKDQYLRLNADFDNFKKRTIKEKEQLATNAKSRVFEAMLPALDNFDLAKANLKTENEGEEKIAKSYEGLVDGLMTILSAQGLSTVAGVGSPFDPNFHEAIMREESEEHPEDTISEEFRKGYKMGEDQLVRAAMVKVSSGPPASEE